MFTRLYLHIPYCLRKCNYCAFVSREYDASSLREYPQLIVAELGLAARQCSPSSPLESVYFGGGTPSLLSPGEAGHILEEIDRCWGLSGDAEITLEANPGTVDHVRLEQFLQAGVNRLSLGLQSFDDRQLATLGRVHDARQGLQSYEAARAAGFRNIGIDLIHSLPGQTLDQWKSTLRQATILAPDHISSYGLTIEEGTPFADRTSDIFSQLPDDDLSADMFEAAVDLLGEAGYRHYEIANFSLPGRQSRHNSGYWQRDGYLGLGAGAHSFLREHPHGYRFCNTTDLTKYVTTIREGNLPRCDLARISREEAKAEYMFLGLRMAEGVHTARFTDEFGETPDSAFGNTVEDLVRSGLLTRDGDFIKPTRRGMLLSNQVFCRFIA